MHSYLNCTYPGRFSFIYVTLHFMHEVGVGELSPKSSRPLTLQYSIVCKFFVSSYLANQISCAMRKPAFRICKKKGTDLLHGIYRPADQCLCFPFIDS